MFSQDCFIFFLQRYLLDMFLYIKTGLSKGSISVRFKLSDQFPIYIYIYEFNFFLLEIKINESLSSLLETIYIRVKITLDYELLIFIYIEE